jgi:hypothetical protein
MNIFAIKESSKMFFLIFLVFVYFAKFFFPVYPPKRVIMYHMTSRNAATKIMQDGFDPNRARSKAFGSGINVSSEFMHVLQYSPDNHPCIIFCMATYHQAMLNESDIHQLIHEVLEDGTEISYSKPKYMDPPPGYDALCYDNIYVFPSSWQVIPMFMISCQLLLKNN